MNTYERQYKEIPAKLSRAVRRAGRRLPGRERRDRPVPSLPSASLPADQLHSLLKPKRRRLSIMRVAEHAEEDGEWPLALNVLVDVVADVELDGDESNLYERRKSIRVALQQHHLPKLDDYAVIDYDRQRHEIAGLGANGPAAAIVAALGEHVSDDDADHVYPRTDPRRYTQAMGESTQPASDADSEVPTNE